MRGDDYSSAQRLNDDAAALEVTRDDVTGGGGCDLR